MENDLCQRFDHNNNSLSPAELRAMYAQMTAECPVAHIDKYGGFTVLSRYDDVLNALRDCETFRSGDGVFIPPTGAPKVAALEYDGEEHDLYRKLMDGPLRLGAVRALQPVIDEVANDLISGFAHRGHANLAAEFAEPLPALVIGRMIGLDKALAGQMRDITLGVFASIGEPDFFEHFAEFMVFVQGQLESRRSNPRDDYLTELASGRIDDVDITDEQVIPLMISFFVGGHHSTAAGIGATIGHVLSLPEARRAVTEGDQPGVARVVEETLRLDTPLHMFARTLNRDTRIGDVELTAGERMMLNLAAANQDPSEFPRPDEFDARRTPNKHVAFGSGRHTCQGQHLARAEMRTAVTVLLQRLPDIRLSGPTIQTPLSGGMLLATTDIPVVFTPVQADASASNAAAPA